MNLSRRKVIAGLKATREDRPLQDDVAENLAARLKSLAVSGSQLKETRRGRVGRKVLAVVGSIGIFTWVGVTGVAASVGLVATGNMPAPIQNVVSSVLEVAGIQVPRAEEDPAPVDMEQSIEDEVDPEMEITTTTLADESVVEAGTDETPVPTETTIPEYEEVVTEPTPTTVVKPVGNKPTTTPNKGQENSNSGNGKSDNSSNSGNANDTNSGNTSNGNPANSGNSGDSGNANNGNAGQGNSGQGNGNGGPNSETVVTAPAVLAPLMPVNEPVKGNSGNQGNNANQNKGKNK